MNWTDEQVLAYSAGGHMPARRHKYGVADKSERYYNGVLYDSKREAHFAAELDLWKKAGIIIGWERQVSYEFVVNGQNIGRMVVDFVVSRLSGRTAMEVKGVETPVYKLKLKLLRALYPNLKYEVVR